MSGRRPLSLLTIGALLIALTVYLTVRVAAGSTDPVPGSGGLPTPADSSEPNTEIPKAFETPLRLTVRTVERGQLIPEGDDRQSKCILESGRQRLTAMATILAGPGAASRAGAAGRHFVRFELDSGVSACRVVELDDGRLPRMLMRPDVSIRGRILGTDGEPIEGATVWAGLADFEGRLHVTTDAAGEFEIVDRFGGRGVPLVVKKQGFASHFRVLDAVDAAAQVEVHLEPAGELRVQLAALVDDPTRGRVHLLPAAADLALRHYPFFEAALGSGRTLDSTGRCAIRDLPARGAVRVFVSHPKCALTREVKVDLARAAAATAVCAAPVPEIPFETRVVDLEGAPVQGAIARLWRDARPPWTRETGWMLPAAAHRVDVRDATADAEGIVTMPRMSGDCTIVVQAGGFCGVRVKLTRGRTGPEEIALPRQQHGVGDDPLLRLLLEPRGRIYRVRTNGGSWRRQVDTEPFELSLDSPQLLDVFVTLEPGDGDAPIERRFVGNAVHGAVELDLAY